MAALKDGQLHTVLSALNCYANEAYGAGLHILIDIIKNNADVVDPYWVERLPEFEEWDKEVSQIRNYKVGIINPL